MSSGVQNTDVNLTVGSDFWPSESLFIRMDSDALVSPPEEIFPSSPPEPEMIPPQDPASTSPPAAEASVSEAVEASSAGTVREAARTSPRPPRAAKRRAIDKIRGIQEWERCPESSELFRRVERRFNEELSNEILTHEEREELEQNPNGLDIQQQAYDDETGSEMSEDESPTASLRDFIVTDDEEAPDDESFHTCSELDSEADTVDETASEHNEDDSTDEANETQPY